jgi:hypothetical protein
MILSRLFRGVLSLLLFELVEHVMVPALGLTVWKLLRA